MFGFIGDVAGKTAEAEGEFAAEVKEGADDDEDAAEKDKQSADLARFHGLRDGGDATEEVGLFGDGFGADGEGVEKI